MNPFTMTITGFGALLPAALIVGCASSGPRIAEEQRFIQLHHVANTDEEVNLNKQQDLVNRFRSAASNGFESTYLVHPLDSSIKLAECSFSNPRDKFLPQRLQVAQFFTEYLPPHRLLGVVEKPRQRHNLNLLVELPQKHF